MATYRELLVSPDGRTVAATSPAEYNDLLYGRGYRRADDVDQPADAEPQRDTEDPERDSEQDTGPDQTEEPTGSVRESDAPADE